MESQTRELTLLGRITIIVLVILAGVAGFKYFMSKEVKIQRRPAKAQAMMVETQVMTQGDHQAWIEAMGTVAPERQVTLKAKLQGEITWMSPAFVQGGVMEKGKVLLTLDDSDYRIALKKAASSLARALSDLEIEKGSQMVAKEELKLINQANLAEIKATDLALRKPQLVQAEASVESARADLEQAKIDLQRTRVILPFNALILEKNVEKGSLVTAQGVLATLVDVDAFRVEALVPPDRLSAIRVAEKNGSPARIHSVYASAAWKGIAARLTGTVTDSSRMAGVIIRVDDPFGRQQGTPGSRLLLGDHVRVKIKGPLFENVFKLPRQYLRDNHTVWIYADGALQIRTVELAWKEDGVIFIRSGIQEGDLLIKTELPAPVNGMSLQTDRGGR